MEKVSNHYPLLIRIAIKPGQIAIAIGNPYGFSKPLPPVWSVPLAEACGPVMED